MDKYIRPILLSSLFIIIFNTVLVLPVKFAALFVYFAGGALTVYLFKRECDENYEISVNDASILGVITGIVVSAILVFIFIFKLQNPDFKRQILDFINYGMQSKLSPQQKTEFTPLNDLGPIFYSIIGIFTSLTTSTICLFGSIAALPFVNKRQA